MDHVRGRISARSTYGKGTAGETLAVEYLREKGYGILQRNFRIGRGEVDIVAVRGEILVFCEVKAWKTFPVENLEYALTREKKRRILAAASAFLAQNRRYAIHRIRFDVIYIEAVRGGRVSHFEGAFNGEHSW